MMIKCRKRLGAAAIVMLLACLATTSLFAAEPMTDVDISYWVRDSLRIDPRVDAARISVASEQGIITLTGTVDNLAAKQYADLEAKKINGVRGVINEITVIPVWRSDADIRHAVKRRILGSAAITSEDIRVTVEDGRVTLLGETPDWGEVQQAGLLASEVVGVKKVTNDIVAVWQRERSDQDIKKDAIAALQRDVYLSGLPIVVDVKGGIIKLKGSVGSAFEANRAMQKVRWISNAKGVVTDFKVEAWEDRGARVEKVWPSDDALVQAVKEELDLDPYVVTADIAVRSNLGTITLDGSVGSYYQSRIAEQDAGNVVGVGQVINNLLVRDASRSDWLIQDDITFNLNTDYALQGLQLKDKVKNGVVTLSGEVNSSFEKYHAGDVAAGVLGVRRVINHISVVRVTWLMSDRSLANDINNALEWNWNTFPVHNNIKVSVADGIATLEGKVNNWSERREAERVAFRTAGIWAVDNRLTVNGYKYQWDQRLYYENIPGKYDPNYYPGNMWKYYNHSYLWDNI